MRARFRSVHAVVGLLAVLAMSAAAEGRASADDSKLANIRIDNFGRINDHYYRGAQPEGRDYKDLAALGVKTVIDLTKDGDADEQQMVESAGMKFRRIPMTTHIIPSPEQVTEFLAVVNDPKNQPVYVHCQGGRHRTGVMTALYRMIVDRWSALQAFAEMKQYKFGADFLHPEFKSFVFSFRPPVIGAAQPDAAGTR